MVTGAGVPQITAILEASRAAKGTGVPVIADGGIKYSGDITKAIAAGAAVTMLGGLIRRNGGIARRNDSVSGAHLQILSRHGLARRHGGGLGATATRRKARRAENPCRRASKAACPIKVRSSALVDQLVGGLKRHGLLRRGQPERISGARRFVRITSAGLRESHVHDVIITREAPNYQVE